LHNVKGGTPALTDAKEYTLQAIIVLIGTVRWEIVRHLRSRMVAGEGRSSKFLLEEVAIWSSV